MAITDWLIGGSSLKRQRDKNIDSAREMYDPSVFNPVMNEQRQRAVEGIPQGQRDIARQRTIQQLFRPQDNAIYGGNQAAAIAGNQAQSANASQALAGFEGQLQSQQIQTQQQAREQFARTSSQAMQMANQRDASIDQIESQYEAERSRRKQGLASAAFGLIGSAVTTPFGPAGQTLAGKALGSVFGGDDSELVSQGQYLADVARAGVGVTDPSVGEQQYMDESFNQVNVPQMDFNNTPLGMTSQQGQQSAGQQPFTLPDNIMNTPRQREMTQEETYSFLDSMGYNRDGTSPITNTEAVDMMSQGYEGKRIDGGGFNMVQDMLGRSQGAGSPQLISSQDVSGLGLRELKEMDEDTIINSINAGVLSYDDIKNIDYTFGSGLETRNRLKGFLQRQFSAEAQNLGTLD